MRAKLVKDFMFEGAIAPFDIFKELEELKNRDIKSIEDVNKVFKYLDVEFINYDTFYNSLKTEKEREMVPPGKGSASLILFAAYNKYRNAINIVVEDTNDFVNILNHIKEDEKEFKRFINFVEEIIKHESIHLQQVDKSKGKGYNLEKSPVNQKEYFLSDAEIMAYANSLVYQLSKKYNKEQIIDKLRTSKKLDSWIHDKYKQLADERSYKKFMKYVYMYTNQL